MLFWARQRGKYRLECRIQAWHDPWCLHKPPPLPVEGVRGMRWWGWRSYTFQRHAENNYAIGFKYGEYGGRLSVMKSGWPVNQLRTTAARWKLTLSQMITYLGCSGHWSLGISLLWRVSRNVIMCAVLYGPRIACWWRSPFLLIAAHIVMLPPRCPRTLMMAPCFCKVETCLGHIY
jgi:hypothetical protein